MKRKTIAGLAAFGAVLGAATAAGIITAKKKQKRLASSEKKSLPPKRNIYFAGGGLAALSGAYYLIRDCGIPGDSISIFEESESIGGAFNVSGNSEIGYVCTAPKFLSKRCHANMTDMLKGLKSVNFPDMSVYDEIINFMNANPVTDNIRLIDDESNSRVSGFGVSKKAIKTIKALLSEKDYDISETTVSDYFIDNPEFMSSNLWELISTAYMLRADSSAAELKHVLKCTAGEITELYTMKNTVRAQLNLQETVINALEHYLRANNVNFATHCCVTDADFDEASSRITAIHLNDNGTAKTFYLNNKDLCFITNGSVSECASIGSYDSPAPEAYEVPASAQLWTRLAEKIPGMGNPAVFYPADDASGIVAFTITTKSQLITEALKSYSASEASQNILTSFKGSPWGLTVSIPPQPYFTSQPDDVFVICGYGVNIGAEGKYTDTTLREASGSQILFELVKHLGLEDSWEEIREGIINVIPCFMPYAAASTLPCSDSEKPLIVSGKDSNFALIGQFAKLGAGISHSSEYAVRTAREAAYRLTGTNKSSAPPPKAGVASYIKLFKALRK